MTHEVMYLLLFIISIMGLMIIIGLSPPERKYEKELMKDLKQRVKDAEKLH